MSWTLTNKLDSFAGPGDMKRREVNWTLSNKLDSFAGPDQEERGELDSHEQARLVCRSRRDQEEGGELDSHEEVRLICGSRIKGRWRMVVLDPLALASTPWPRVNQRFALIPCRTQYRQQPLLPGTSKGWNVLPMGATKASTRDTCFKCPCPINVIKSF